MYFSGWRSNGGDVSKIERVFMKGNGGDKTATEGNTDSQKPRKANGKEENAVNLHVSGLLAQT